VEEGDGIADEAEPGTLRLRTGPGRWVVLATVAGSGMAMIDSTVVGIALPTIGRDFRVPLGPLQWVVTAYILTLAAFLLLGGSLGDRFGRRRVFMVGVGWFAAASVLCGLSPDAPVLIAMRALQGVGGALLTPGSLAIIQASFSPEDRSRAIGAWSGLGGVAAAAGPVLGGYLVSAVSWRWIFFINVPVAAVVLLASTRHVPESHDPSASGHSDVRGALLGVGCLGGANYALIEGSSRGWTSPDVLTAAALAVSFGTAFAFAESSGTSPMLPMAMFKRRQFSATNAVTFVVYAALGGAFFLVPIELQEGLGYSPLSSGLALVPVTVIMLVLSARSGSLSARIGPRLQMSAGPVVVAAGLALLVRATSGGGYLEQVLPALVVFGLGLAITVAPLTATAMDSVPVEHAGIASAVNNDVARIGGLVAVALLPWLSGIVGSAYLHPHEISAGFRTAVLIAAAACAAGGCLSALTIRNPARRRHPEDEGPVRAGSLVAGSGAPELVHCALDAPPLHCE
jgi:EmrB/QacA subfamily drug resistance transporter